MSKPSSHAIKDLRLAERRLTNEDMALMELYQRQDSMVTQLWQQFLLANASVVAVVLLISNEFKTTTVGPGIPLSWVLSVPVLVVWSTFTYGGLSALLNSQDILLAFAHQIHGDIGDKAELFVRTTRDKLGITVFHVLVDFGILALCIFLLVLR